MFSISPSEILTIAVIALLIFGPKRLPEMSRKAGKLLRDLRGATSDLRTELEAEYREAVEPLQDVRDTMRDAISGTNPPPADPSDTEDPAA